MEKDTEGSVSHPSHRGSELFGWDADRRVEGALSPRIWDLGTQALYKAVLAGVS